MATSIVNYFPEFYENGGNHSRVIVRFYETTLFSEQSPLTLNHEIKKKLTSILTIH